MSITALKMWMRFKSIARRGVSAVLPDESPIRGRLWRMDRFATDIISGTSSGRLRRGKDAERFAAMLKLPFGVNVIGDFGGVSGLSMAANAGIRALTNAGLPLSAVDVGADGVGVNVDAFRFRVNLLHLKPGRIGEFFCGNEAGTGRDRYNIAYWAWEMPSLPPVYAADTRFLDEIWTPSEFSAAAIRRSTRLPVCVVPHAITDSGSADRARFGFGDGEYVFLLVFDFMSLSARKNPEAAVLAFRKAFGDGDGVRLVIKHVNADRCPKALDKLASIADGHNVTFMGNSMAREEVMSLIASCDCYVSLHRAEGFGLTIAEAMSLGKPVVATAYSGNMDFMSEDNSYPVKYSPVPLNHDLPPYSKGDVWAEPDIDHAASVMRKLREHPDDGVETGRRARREVLDMLSPESVGRLCAGLLEESAGDAAVKVIATGEEL